MTAITTAPLIPDTTIDPERQMGNVVAALADQPELLALYRRLMETVPLDAFRALIARHGSYTGHSVKLKFLDAPYWVHNKLTLAVRLGLHRGAPRRILDIGMGCGHFSYVCQALGHEIIGLDKHNAMYDEVAALLGVTRTGHLITRRERALPAFDRPFDLITGFLVQFDDVPGEGYWTAAEWRDFLARVLDGHLARPGRLFLTLTNAIDPDTGATAPKTYVGPVARSLGGSYDPATNVLDIAVPA